jgi:nitroimidazol reductase NimA-like FMN-containing flavoprotein (pyridoxamine 5'-phosphate oxidase superfamily)
MTEKDIEGVIKSNNICRIAFIDGAFPYISPFQYLYEDGAFYFHLTDYGKKVRILRNNNHVCVSIEEFDEDLSKYQFISIQGELIEIEKVENKKSVIKKMVNEASKSYSETFLKAHGFDKDDGWEALSSTESIRIFTLKEKGDRIGLQSG